MNTHHHTLIVALVVFGVIVAGTGAYFAMSRAVLPPARPLSSPVAEESVAPLPQIHSATTTASTSTIVIPTPSSTPPYAPSVIEKPTPPPEPSKLPPRIPQEYITEIWSNTDWRPPSYTIHVGDTVTFVNHDDALHWPGADPHPTHSALPPFDALGGISKGQTYSYTFRKLGVFGHHEHLIEENPPTIGYITVLP